MNRICVDAETPPGWIPFWDLVYGTPGRRPAVLPDTALDAYFAYPFSSGTTGLPKAVRHTHRSLVAAIINWNSACAVRHEDHLQFFLPLFHIYGIAITGCTRTSAATLTLIPRFDLDGMLQHIADERLTLAFGAAPIALAMANHPDSSATTSRRCATCVGGHADHRGRRPPRHRADGHPWLGATAPPRFPACTEPGRLPGSVPPRHAGPAVSDLEVRIVDLETHETSRRARRASSCAGPAHDGRLPPARGRRRRVPRRLVRTGDVGWMEPEGWIHITDRVKEMIKVSGF